MHRMLGNMGRGQKRKWMNWLPCALWGEAEFQQGETNLYASTGTMMLSVEETRVNEGKIVTVAHMREDRGPG